MLIKPKNSIAAALAELLELRNRTGLSHQRVKQIEDEVFQLRAGDRGERDAAYFIDFELGQSRNYAIIHDLRIEHEGRVAQIDHLIIGRMLDIILIESKNFGTAIRRNGQGEFEVKTRYGWKGMESPVEQNRRHASVLLSFLKGSGLLPLRLGFQIVPDIYQWVLVPAECSVVAGRHKTEIIKMDMFGARMREWMERASTGEVFKVAKAVSSATLHSFATMLAASDRHITIDYEAKFGLSSTRKISAASETSAHVSSRVALCTTCGISVDEKVAAFCRSNERRFGKKIHCRVCQPAITASCDECFASVDNKTAAFCRFNHKRFAKRILCRECQMSLQAFAATGH